MKIKRSIDVEDAVRELLKDHMTAYCRPLPSDFAVPSVLVTQIGGGDTDEIDTFEIMLDSRAETEAEADPVRPDLAMCSSHLVIVAHLEEVTI